MCVCVLVWSWYEGGAGGLRAVLVDGCWKTGRDRMAVDISETHSFKVPRLWLSSRPNKSPPLYPFACICCVRASCALLYCCVWCVVCLYCPVHVHVPYFCSLPSCTVAVMYLPLHWMHGGQGTAETTDVNIQGQLNNTLEHIPLSRPHPSCVCTCSACVKPMLFLHCCVLCCVLVLWQNEHEAFMLACFAVIMSFV